MCFPIILYHETICILISIMWAKVVIQQVEAAQKSWFLLLALPATVCVIFNNTGAFLFPPKIHWKAQEASQLLQY